MKGVFATVEPLAAHSRYFTIKLNRNPPSDESEYRITRIRLSLSTSWLVISSHILVNRYGLGRKVFDNYIDWMWITGWSQLPSKENDWVWKVLMVTSLIWIHYPNPYIDKQLWRKSRHYEQTNRSVRKTLKSSHERSVFLDLPFFCGVVENVKI